MKHSEFIKSFSKRGEHASYAKFLGISPSFLSQIKTGRAVTPKRLYSRVINNSKGVVTLKELEAELAKKDSNAV